jgi:hypothetical protein
MLKITAIIMKANGATENDHGHSEEVENLDKVLTAAASSGQTILSCLQGLCPVAASNPVFIDHTLNQLKTQDGASVTANSPLMSIIHEEA